MVECACGRDRMGCEYHDPMLQPADFGQRVQKATMEGIVNLPPPEQPPSVTLETIRQDLLDAGVATPEEYFTYYTCWFPKLPAIRIPPWHL